MSVHCAGFHSSAVFDSVQMPLSFRIYAGLSTTETPPGKEVIMTLGTILLVILILILIGALPSWGYSRSWGYAPSGITGLLVVILLIMLLTGYI